MSEKINHHRIDYIEFPAASPAPAKEFYSAVFNWKFTDYGPQYTAFEDGRLAGGFQASSTGQSSKPLVVIYSSDLEATLASVKKAGGTITKEIFSFPGGRRFQFVDPVGNELAVWSE